MSCCKVYDDEDAVCRVDKLQHVPGTRNVGDMPTRGNIELQDMDWGSCWQVGPEFIAEARDTWPIKADFARKVPPSETRKKFIVTAICMMQDMARPKVQDLLDVMNKFNSLTKIKHVFARLIRASRFKDRKQIEEYPSFHDFRIAEQLIKCLSMMETTKMLAKGELESLLPFRAEGCWYTRGRLGGKSLRKHLSLNNLCKHFNLKLSTQTLDEDLSPELRI